MTIVDRYYRTAVPKVSKEEAQGDAERLLRGVGDREVALRFITTSGKRYKDEFATYIRTGGRVVGPEMQRTACRGNELLHGATVSEDADAVA